MALTFFERIADLGAQGVLTLTLDSDAYLPLPAHTHGRFVWHDAQGGRHDRLTLCTRAPGAAALQAAAVAQRQRFAAAAPSVRGRVDWVAARIGDEYREAPYQMGVLDGGRALFVFGGVVGPRALRVVDVAADRVLAEETVEDLGRRLGVKPLLPDRPLDAVLHATGGPWIGFWLGSGFELLTVRDGRLERAGPAVLVGADRIALTPAAWYVKRYDSSDVHVFEAAADGREVARVAAPRARDGVDLAGACLADRCLLAHPGGTIEWLDARGRRLGALRPFPAMARNDSAFGWLSAYGRHALCGYNPLALVDLDRACQVEVADFAIESPPGGGMTFVPEVHYRSETRAGHLGLLRLHDGVLSVEPYDGFDWQPSLVPAARARRKAARPVEDPAWAALRKPAFALQPAKNVSGASRLYGLPQLARTADWPQHEGRPMLLLCQLDLGAVAASATPGPLPAEGALLFFVAADAEGEPLLDELFHPSAWRVLWLNALAPEPLARPAGLPEPPAAQPLKIVADGAVWPQPDAAVVQALGWAPAAIEAYRQFVDAALPDGPKSGHRLGGYPTIVQHNDLELDAAQAAGDDGAAARWRLLLQLDSDDTFMWGTDSGTLYFMVHDDDLARRDFSRVVALTQGA